MTNLLVSFGAASLHTTVHNVPLPFFHNEPYSSRCEVGFSLRPNVYDVYCACGQRGNSVSLFINGSHWSCFLDKFRPVHPLLNYFSPTLIRPVDI